MALENTTDTSSPAPAPAPDTNADLGNTFDMESAVDSLGESLGFTEEEGEKTSAPAPAPSPTSTPSPTSSPASSPAPAPAPASGVRTPPSLDVEKAPNTWSPVAAAKWGALPIETRQEIIKREADIFKGIEQYRGAANFAREVQQVLRPVEQLLVQHNVPPTQFLGNLVNAHVTLSNPQTSAAEKQTLAINLLKSYGIPLPSADPLSQTYQDPEVLDLRQQLQSLQSRLQSTENQTREQVRGKIANDIKAFAEDPANTYFEEVADDIALLIRGSGGQMPLAEAYARAVRSNPVTFAKEVSRLNAEAIETAKKADAEKLAKARKAAGTSLKTSGLPGSETAASGSMEDTMEQTMRQIKSRG